MKCVSRFGDRSYRVFPVGGNSDSRQYCTVWGETIFPIMENQLTEKVSAMVLVTVKTIAFAIHSVDRFGDRSYPAFPVGGNSNSRQDRTVWRETIIPIMENQLTEKVSAMVLVTVKTIAFAIHSVDRFGDRAYPVFPVGGNSDSRQYCTVWEGNNYPDYRGKDTSPTVDSVPYAFGLREVSKSVG